MGDLYDRAGSGGTPKAGDSRYYGGGIPFLGISDMEGRYITRTQKSLTEDGLANSAAWIVPEGSVSLAMYASVGKVGITCCDMATSQAFYNMVFDSPVTRDFVYTRLDKADCQGEWRNLISTGTQSNLNAKKVRDWPVVVPSLPEQHAIGALFRDLDSLITLHQRELVASVDGTGRNDWTSSLPNRLYYRGDRGTAFAVDPMSAACHDVRNPLSVQAAIG